MIKDATRTPVVLLVEDSSDDAYFFKRALKRTGLECSCVHVWDGRSAIEFLEQAFRGPDLPQVVFLDLKLPVLNGFEVLEWLRQQSVPKKPKVVVLSGSDQDSDKAQAAELGASGYLVKPIASRSIADLLQSAGPAKACCAQP